MKLLAPKNCHCRFQQKRGKRAFGAARVILVPSVFNRILGNFQISLEIFCAHSVLVRLSQHEVVVRCLAKGRALTIP